MSRLTLGMCRQQLHRFCGPNGPASVDVPNRINQVCQQLFNAGMLNGTVKDVPRWLGTEVPADFVVYNGQVTLPRNVARLITVGIRGFTTSPNRICPYLIRNDWYSFQTAASDQCSCDFLPIGSGYVTFRGLPSAGKLKIYTSTGETAAQTFHIRGYASGSKVFTGTGASRIEGENITIPASVGSTISNVTYDGGNSLYLITKPVLNGAVTLFHVDPATLAETKIGSYEPGEQVPDYRRYLVPSLSDTTDQIVAKVKLAPVDVLSDADEVIPGNINAIEMALQALSYRRKEDLKLSETYLSMAIRELNNELQEASEPDFGSLLIEPGLLMGSDVLV